MKSAYALAAAQIKKELKRNNIPCSVRSEGYSMGSSVNVRLLDNPLPATVEKVKTFAAKYQYGHFDGMTDCYEMSNSREDLPQAKFVFVETEYSAEFKQLVWDHIRQTKPGANGAPVGYQDATWHDVAGERGGHWVQRVLNGSDCPEFWTAHKKRIRP